MNTYIDSSVLLRIVLGEPDPLDTWVAIDLPVSSELIRVECLRTIDRARIRLGLDDARVARHRADVLEKLRALTLIAIDGPVLERAAETFPTLLGSLDAIHLATALLARSTIPALTFATHDASLATAARATGFTVEGVRDG